MFEVHIQIDVDLPVSLPTELGDVLKTAVQTTLRHQNATPPGSLTLLLTDDEQLQQLNRDFRQIDQITDVLSFPDGSIIPQVGKYLGDIAISVPQASRQAESIGHPLLAELQLLTVHGVLHLLGHDHATAEEKAVMWQAQEEILTALN